jgi:hypothetical protein
MTVRKGYHRQENHRHDTALRANLARSRDSVPMLEYAAGMGQERLLGETAEDKENGGYP